MQIERASYVKRMPLCRQITVSETPVYASESRQWQHAVTMGERADKVGEMIDINASENRRVYFLTSGWS